VAKRNFRVCPYVTDEGKGYLKRLDSRYQSQMNTATTPAPILGAIPATQTQLDTMSESASRVKPRSILVRTTAGDFTARLPVFTVDAYNAIALGDAINFYDGQGTQHAGVVYGKEGERLLHKQDVT
jgi:hypothetical protein